MSKVFFVNHTGQRVTFDANTDSTVMETALANNVSGIMQNVVERAHAQPVMYTSNRSGFLW